MPSVFSEAVVPAPLESLPRKKWTRCEIEELISKGFLLVVEAATASLRLDLSQKAGLYARAGIPDYWVLDTDQRRMIVHRDPTGGKYGSVIVYSEEEGVAPLAAPESEFRVAAAFGR